MATKKSSTNIDWSSLINANLVYVLGLLGALIAFYYTTNATLAKHDDQFKRLEEAFKGFGETSKGNFEKYLAIMKSDAEKAEVRSKEDREAREKIRNDFQQFLTASTTNQTVTREKVDTIGKVLDQVQNKLDSISNVQQQNRHDIIRQQGRGR